MSCVSVVGGSLVIVRVLDVYFSVIFFSSVGDCLGVEYDHFSSGDCRGVEYVFFPIILPLSVSLLIMKSFRNAVYSFLS